MKLMSLVDRHMIRFFICVLSIWLPRFDLDFILLVCNVLTLYEERERDK